MEMIALMHHLMALDFHWLVYLSVLKYIQESIYVH